MLMSVISFGQDLVVTGVFDGPLSGGTPKLVEVYVVNDIADLSTYGIGSANNGGGTDNQELAFTGSATAGNFIYVAYEGSNPGSVQTYFNITADYLDSSASINGDDAIELFKDGNVIDTFGDINVDGTGEPWEYLDGWAYKKSGTAQDGATFTLANWDFSGTNAVDGCTTNATCASQFPIGTYSNSANTNPSLAIVSPGNNEVFTPGTTAVDVSLSVSNFNVASGTAGDGHIHYSVNGGAEVMKFDTNDFQLTNLTAGDYELKVWLVDNSHMPLDPAVEKTVNFTIAGITQVADLATLRAGNSGDYYEVTGEIIMTYARSNRNQKYFQDNTAGVLIDDNSGIVTTVYNTGDGVTGLKGRLSSFNGVTQFVPLEDPGTASSSGNTITPEVVSLADFEANSNDYESELITIENALFTDGGGTFAEATNYEITSAGATSNFRTNFSEADYIGTAIPTGTADITVLGGEFNGDPQVTAINLASMVLGVTENQINGFAVYPNPVNGNSIVLKTTSSVAKDVNIYNILGKKVLSQEITGFSKGINVASLSSGVYILKVDEEGKTASKKLVIK